MPHALGFFAPILLSLYLAIFPMAAAGVAWRLRKPALEASYVLIFATVWIATEYLRGTLLTGYRGTRCPKSGSRPRSAASGAWLGTYALSESRC